MVACGNRQALAALALLGAAVATVACSKAFRSADPDAEWEGAGGDRGFGGSSAPADGGMPGGEASAPGLGGVSNGAPACSTDDDCPRPVEPNGCSDRGACVDGACVVTLLQEGSPCDGGSCDAQGRCRVSTCDSAAQDGDESSVDCGGSCPLCPDGESCNGPEDCLSGVCADRECQSSACTDEVKNGSETGVDCGGPCPLKCALEEGCATTADCAVAAGDGPESVRCVAKTCVSTKPPSAGGPPAYWQDFEPKRLQVNAVSCAAADNTCLTGNGVLYQMGGIGPGGVDKPLTAQLLFSNTGVVGGAGKFDGYTCLTRPGTDLSLPNAAAFTAMAWVKSTRVAAPWESAIIGALDHYFIAVDTNQASQRFLAAARTAQTASFAYHSSANTGEVPAGEWHHVAATYDTSAAQLLQYVDGKLVQTTRMTGNITTGPVAVYLGCRKDVTVSYFFQGNLDEVAVYRRALGAEEIADYVRRTAPP